MAQNSCFNPLPLVKKREKTMAHLKPKIKTSTSLDQKLSKKGKALSIAKVTSWARPGQ